MPKALLSALFIFAGVAVLGFMVLPQYQQFINLKQQRDGLKTQLAERQTYFGQVLRAFAALSQEQEILDRVESALPQPFDSGRLLHLLQNLAQQNGLIISQVNMSSGLKPQLSQQEQSGQSEQVKPLPRYLEANVSLQMSGSYPALKNFLASLEKSARLVEPVLVDFGSRADGPASFINLTLKVRHY